MIKNQANIYQFVLRDMIGQGVTGLSPTVRIRKDTGSFAATTNTPTEVGNGLYEVALTATECNCDIMAIEVSLPDGQFPAILTNEYLTTTGGATPAEIWGYAGGRTVTNTIPTAADNATAVWGASTKEVTIATAQANTFATADALSSVANNVSAVKAKTDNLPNNPAAVGSEMGLTSAAISAVQNGLATSTNVSDSQATIIAAMPSVSGLSTFNPATDRVLIDATQAASMQTATGFATPTNVTDAVTALETYGDNHWSTATGFTVPADLSGLATSEGLAYNLNLLTQHGDTNWQTANVSGLATSSQLSTATEAITAAIPDVSGLPTAADIWEYTDRTLTEEISVEISSENIADITESVWNADDRTLTDLTPKPNQKNIVCTPSNVINAYGIPRLENWTNETAGTQAFDDKINTYITLAKEKMTTDLNDQINAAIAYIGADNITELCAWLTGYNLYKDDESTDTDSLPETRYNQYLEQIHRIMENI